MKKIYDKPLTNTTTVRQQTCFCSSIYETKRVETRGHEVGGEYSFKLDKDGSAVSDGFEGGKVTWGENE